jgi:mono/diheme cytochrome c family protein
VTQHLPRSNLFVSPQGYWALSGRPPLVLTVGAGLYAHLGFYDVAASNPHTDAVRWSLEEIQDNSISRRAKEDVASAPSLDDPDMISTGGKHYQEEGCLTCHGGPAIAQAEFAEQMRPEPPDLTKAAATWKDNELYLILQHGIKMTGMPAFGPTHDEKELWGDAGLCPPPTEYVTVRVQGTDSCRS